MEMCCLLAMGVAETPELHKLDGVSTEFWPYSVYTVKYIFEGILARKVYIYKPYRKRISILESSTKEVKYQKYYKIWEEKAITI